jgi:hypothetical protein
MFKNGGFYMAKDTATCSLSRDEEQAIRDRVLSLVEAENKKPGFIFDRCNGTNRSNRKYFMRRFDGDTKKAETCVKWLEEHGGYCNCEVLLNVYPNIDQFIQKS